MSNKISLQDMLYSAMFAAIISVLGLVSIDVGPVPITGQTLGVMLAGSILTTRQSAFSVLTFLLLGAIGVPVFAGGKGGLAILISPRGGYLLGFLVGAIIISLIKSSGNNILRLGIANFVGGIIAIYTFGVIGLMIISKMGLIAAITANLPFIPGDIFKVVIATIVGVAVNKQLERLNRA